MQLLVFAKDNTHPDKTKDRQGCYKRGYVVAVKDDAHTWGAKEGLPDFYVLKLPKIPVSKGQKYNEAERDENYILYRRRLWTVRLDDLPTKEKTALNKGELVIKATALHVGASDTDWATMKDYFRNQKTGLDETEDL